MKKVLLTGISGFIGQHCAVELLNKGYAVRGSVRNLKKSAGIQQSIQRHVDSIDHLEFCELDLLKDDGWEEAASGCDFVMHVASPFFSKIPKDENELIQPAVEGTIRALNAAYQAGVQRVVLTSSMVAMLGDLQGDEHIHQGSWTNVHAKHITAYLKSKTLAEQKAWEFVKGKDLELVTIHPGPVYGPPLNGNLSGESMTLFKRLLTGEARQMINASINMSDVRDIASIHVAALENKQAADKRFIVASEIPHSFSEITHLLKSSGYKSVSTQVAPNFMVKLLANFNSEMKGFLPYLGKKYRGDISTTKSTFNWEPIPFDQMVLDTAQSVKQVLDGQK
ncbi:NAD-dependent epimerase/dehydratase family protein [Pontibacter sp. G13]|uniref:NAD-dependent epimerase/dehydratase family protein n=1 Tax=Pontibacter sp. G13 TaxID=3074898 RepID=UPI002888FE70|nr:NAD-dependent epimerase/dehydratase family protein [Pontibacter sp. G13]WNJ17126.1 NAD-dependent epimerase/dehydratase family protein [Pontibacter sp. G13]